MSPSRMAKLPPIADEGETQRHPSSLFLETATAELKDTMQHLLCEVRVWVTVSGSFIMGERARCSYIIPAKAMWPWLGG